MVNVAAVNVLAELGTAIWPAPQAVSYEIALDGVRQAIGFYAELIAQEEAADEPDTAAIEGWRSEQRGWAARGQELTPLDVKAIKRIRADADELLSVEDPDEDDDTDEDDTDDEDDDTDEDDTDDDTDEDEDDGDGLD